MFIFCRFLTCCHISLQTSDVSYTKLPNLMSIVLLGNFTCQSCQVCQNDEQLVRLLLYSSVFTSKHHRKTACMHAEKWTLCYCFLQAQDGRSVSLSLESLVAEEAVRFNVKTKTQDIMETATIISQISQRLKDEPRRKERRQVLIQKETVAEDCYQTCNELKMPTINHHELLNL